MELFTYFKYLITYWVWLVVGMVAGGVVAGSIAAGKLANLIITKPVPSLHYLPYAFAHNHIEKVMLAGEWV